MKLRSKGLLLLLAMMLVVTSVGCPNSTVITGGNGSVQVRFSAVNQGRWDFAIAEIRSLLVRPLDPSSSNIAPGSYSLTPTPIAVGLFDALTTPEDFDITHLAQGEYQIVSMEFNRLLIADGDAVTPPACANFFPPVFTLSSFPAPPTFSVARDVDDFLTLTIDLEGLGDALNTACSGACSTGCFATFNSGTFAGLIDTYLTVD